MLIGEIAAFLGYFPLKPSHLKQPQLRGRRNFRFRHRRIRSGGPAEQRRLGIVTGNLGRHLPGVGIGITIPAKMGAGVIGADIDRRGATAIFPGRFGLSQAQRFSRQILDPSGIDTLAVFDSVRR